MGARDTKLDVIRGLAIILIVLGHCPGLPAELIYIIYGFHVPVFFLVGGAVFKFEQGIGSLLRRVSLLFRYYLIFYVLAALSYIAESLFLGRSIDVAEIALQFIYSQSGMIVVNPVLWFFPAYMVTMVATYLMWRIPLSRLWICLMTFVVGTLAIYLSEGAWLWCANNAIIAMPFFMLGAIYKQYKQQADSIFLKRRLGLIVLLLSYAYATIAVFNGRVDLNGLRFGQYYFLYYPLAFAGSLILFWVGGVFSGVKQFGLIGRYSLYVFALHPIVFQIVSLIYLLIDRSRDTVFATLSYCIVGVVVPILLAKIWQRIKMVCMHYRSAY